MAETNVGPVTEVVYIPLKAGLDLGNPDNKAVWDSTLATFAKQKGLNAVYWGRQVEDPDTLQLLQGKAFFILSASNQPTSTMLQ